MAETGSCAEKVCTYLPVMFENSGVPVFEPEGLSVSAPEADSARLRGSPLGCSSNCHTRYRPYPHRDIHGGQILRAVARNVIPDFPLDPSQVSELQLEIFFLALPKRRFCSWD